MDCLAYSCSIGRGLLIHSNASNKAKTDGCVILIHCNPRRPVIRCGRPVTKNKIHNEAFRALEWHSR